jgi:hypothetical protein
MRPIIGRDIPAAHSIKAYIHCSRCIAEVEELAAIQGSASPALYARFEVGWTVLGLQVWCPRHHVNIMHVDFQGAVHPANTQAT